ncbi:hypothetical protein M5K25_004975 [Dendrobium thyrsiflorum]|uniref:Uncharacterized protein n=1 Tax=Dendrobium thyrsiflorum TaxID=117978 RepID=A0ABD0VHN1_DENTH
MGETIGMAIISHSSNFSKHGNGNTFRLPPSLVGIGTEAQCLNSDAITITPLLTPICVAGLVATRAHSQAPALRSQDSSSSHSTRDRKQQAPVLPLRRFVVAGRPSQLPAATRISSQELVPNLSCYCYGGEGIFCNEDH